MADSIKRLLVMSCSKRKLPSPGLLSAIERYDGPAFHVLRRFLRERPDESGQLDVYVVSAAHGWISGSDPIADYDQLMTRQRAAELHDATLAAFAKTSGSGYGALCLALSRKYLNALDGWKDVVPGGLALAVADGPQGTRLSKLKQWLRQQPVNQEAPQRTISPRGVARLRGIEVRLTISEVMEKAQAALSNGSTGADLWREWYVDVDGRRVSPKWLVSLLTGLPVSAYTAGDARRVLQQLGICSRSLRQEGGHESYGH